MAGQHLCWEFGPLTLARLRTPAVAGFNAGTVYEVVVVVPFSRDRVSLQLLLVVLDGDGE